MIYGFEETFNLLLKDEEASGSFAEHPMYKILYRHHLKNIKEISYEVEHPGGFNTSGEAAKNEAEMVHAVPVPEIVEGEKKSDEDELIKKRQKSCDEILSEYLGFTARKIHKEYYKKVLRFVLLLRECLNENADRLNEEKKSLPQGLCLRNLPEGEEKEYTETNNAEQVPDISNDFIIAYLDDKREHLSTQESIDLIQSLCHWLFINGYTCSKISLIQ